MMGEVVEIAAGSMLSNTSNNLLLSQEETKPHLNINNSQQGAAFVVLPH